MMLDDVERHGNFDNLSMQKTDGNTVFPERSNKKEAQKDKSQHKKILHVLDDINAQDNASDDYDDSDSMPVGRPKHPR